MVRPVFVFEPLAARVTNISTLAILIYFVIPLLQIMMTATTTFQAGVITNLRAVGSVSNPSVVGPLAGVDSRKWPSATTWTTTRRWAETWV